MHAGPANRQLRYFFLGLLRPPSSTRYCDRSLRALYSFHASLRLTGPAPRYPDDYLEFAVRWARERVDREIHSTRSATSVSIRPARLAGTAEAMMRPIVGSL